MTRAPHPVPGSGTSFVLDRCVRLPFHVDAPRLAAEISALPEREWGEPGRDPVVLGAVESLFVVGYPRGVRLRPPDDRPTLERLPYLREILHGGLADGPVRAILARQRAGSLVPLHRDVARVFRTRVRLSIQVDSDGPQRFVSGKRWYTFSPGEVWAIDNLALHGIRNTGAGPRLNVIVDYPKSPAIAARIAAGDGTLGREDAAALAEIDAASRATYRSVRFQRLRRNRLVRLLLRP